MSDCIAAVVLPEELGTVNDSVEPCILAMWRLLKSILELGSILNSSDSLSTPNCTVFGPKLPYKYKNSAQLKGRSEDQACEDNNKEPKYNK